MNAGRFMAGATIVVVVIVAELFGAYMASESLDNTPQLTGCNASQNVTQCQTLSKTSFLSALFSVTVSGFDGINPFLNLLWVTIMGALLAIGVILMVISFIPLVTA